MNRAKRNRKRLKDIQRKLERGKGTPKTKVNQYERHQLSIKEEKEEKERKT